MARDRRMRPLGLSNRVLFGEEQLVTGPMQLKTDPRRSCRRTRLRNLLVLVVVSHSLTNPFSKGGGVCEVRESKRSPGRECSAEEWLATNTRSSRVMLS